MDMRRKRRIVKAALDRQGGLCCWCDMPITDGKLTGEHLTPRHRGGRWNLDNISAACFNCNHARADHPAPADSYLQFQRINYLRSVGIYAAFPWSRNRETEQPNFGLDPEGSPIWAPQYGIVRGPEHIDKHRGVAQW